jgi:hypothetical protein
MARVGCGPMNLLRPPRTQVKRAAMEAAAGGGVTFSRMSGIQVPTARTALPVCVQYTARSYEYTAILEAAYASFRHIAARASERAVILACSAAGGLTAYWPPVWLPAWAWRVSYGRSGRTR